MRFSNLAFFAVSSLALSTFASPLAQVSPPVDDSFEPTGTAEPWYPIATEMPTVTGDASTTTDTGYMTIQTSMPPTTTTDDGMFTIQTSTPDASPTTTSDECEATDVAEENDDDDDWCDDDDEESASIYPTSSIPATETPTSVDPVYPTSTPPPSTLAPGIYQIYPVRALISRCLQVAKGQEPADGTPVISASCDGSPEQDWEVVPAQWYPPAGNLYIKLAGTNFCLDASFPLGSGTPMKIWTCYDGLVQQRWNYAEDSSLYLVDQDQCLDLTDGNIDDGAGVQTWECTPGNANQHWFVLAKPE